MVTIDALEYPIVVATGALSQLSTLLHAHAPAHQYAIVTDENVARHYLPLVRETLATDQATRPTREPHAIVIPPGEQHKTREQWAAITDALLASGAGRDTTIIALGGGVIGDLAGFVAATYMRGIPVVQVPTTLLAMVDASVGGKTAVDTPAGKNTVGAFHPPSLVVIDPATLASLPPRELRAGLAEVIKHGVIASRAEIDAVMEVVTSFATSHAVPPAIESLIERSVRIKATIVAADEREHGLRKVLNFGHTIGHGVEAASDYVLLHGEAIAIGMVAESRVAERAGIAEAGTAAAIERVIANAGLPTTLPSDVAPDRVLRLMRADKKRRAGALEYALPKRVGTMAGESSGWAVAIPDAVVMDVLRNA
jgi:3-dehydroquinate synthase